MDKLSGIFDINIVALTTIYNYVWHADTSGIVILLACIKRRKHGPYNKQTDTK